MKNLNWQERTGANSMQADLSVDLSLILPLYNEGDILASNLKTILGVLQSARWKFEMLLIDDASRDDTAQTAAAFAAAHPETVRFFHHEMNQGRGATVMDGFRQGRGTVVGFMDVDCETSPQYFLGFIPDLLSGRRDAITGLRIYPFSFSVLHRVIMSFVYRWFVQRLLGVGFHDRQSGYKFFRRDKILPLLTFLKSSGWFWDTEVMVVADMAGLAIEERPVLFLRDSRKKSTVRLLRDSWQMARQLVSYRWQLSYIRSQLKLRKAETLPGTIPVSSEE